MPQSFIYIYAKYGHIIGKLLLVSYSLTANLKTNRLR